MSLRRMTRTGGGSMRSPAPSWAGSENARMMWTERARNSSGSGRARNAYMTLVRRNYKMNLRGYDFAPTPTRFSLNDSVVPTQGNAWTSITENLKKITETAVPAYLQYRVFRENLKRADQNKPPLDPNVYAPSMSVKVGPSDELVSAGRTVGFGVAGIALGVLGLYLLLKR